MKGNIIFHKFSITFHVIEQRLYPTLREYNVIVQRKRKEENEGNEGKEEKRKEKKRRKWKQIKYSTWWFVMDLTSLAATSVA